jgi:hypothetical protein
MDEPVFTTDELRTELREAWNADAPHVERMTAAAAVIAHALGQAGLRATLVGGAAIEFYAPGGYSTTDLDFVIEGGPWERVGTVMESIGLKKYQKFWVLDDLFVEVPGSSLEWRVTELVPVGPFQLRILKKEHLVVDRIVGFRRWKTWAYGIQAIDLLGIFGEDLDEEFLRTWLRKEGSEEALDHLREIAASGVEITTRELDSQWHQRYR